MRELYHPNVICNGCEGCIDGKRWYCKICNFDLCNSCHNMKDHKHTLYSTTVSLTPFIRERYTGEPVRRSYEMYRHPVCAGVVMTAGIDDDVPTKHAKSDGGAGFAMLTGSITKGNTQTDAASSTGHFGEIHDEYQFYIQCFCTNVESMMMTTQKYDTMVVRSTKPVWFD